MSRMTLTLSAWILLYLSLIPAHANDYSARKSAAVGRCEAIDPSTSQSGLLFNPDGYKSYYVQSQCLQNAAVEFRDEALCSRVRRRWSLLWSSWGISPGQCRELVSQGMAADRTELEKQKTLYHGGPVRLQNFRIERNGNGRDFDFIPQFSDGYAHGYSLTFEIVDVREQPVLLHSDGYYLDANSNLRIYVRQADIRARLPEFELNHRYKVRATVVLSVSSGGSSDEFVESVFPARERSQSVTIESLF